MALSTPPEGAPRTRASLSLVLLLYFLGIVGVITVAPFQFAVPEHVRILTSGDWFDVVANVPLFLPLGFLYPLTRPADREPSPLQVLFLGVLLSATIETIQQFEPERYTSVVDVMTNATGALLGALLQRFVRRRIRLNAQLVGRLSLEIPLIGLIYLLVPLVFVASLSGVEHPVQLIALVPLGLVGARLMAVVQRSHFGNAGLMSSDGMAMIAGAWMFLGVFPVVLHVPWLGIGLVLLVGAATWYESTRPHPSIAERGDRRFEAEALRSAAPYVVLYFVAMLLLPLAPGIGPWHAGVGLGGAESDLDRLMLRMLEPVAALTLLGYLLAESRGRRELPFRESVRRIAMECAGVALLIEASHGIQPGAGASSLRVLLEISAGVLGAAIYHHQRAHVHWLLAHRRGPARVRSRDLVWLTGRAPAAAHTSFRDP